MSISGPMIVVVLVLTAGLAFIFGAAMAIAGLAQLLNKFGGDAFLQLFIGGAGLVLTVLFFRHWDWSKKPAGYREEEEE